MSPTGREAASIEGEEPGLKSAFAPRVGDGGGSRCAGAKPRGVQESDASVDGSVNETLPWFSFEGVEVKCAI
jgi:hypothetical protein